MSSAFIPSIWADAIAQEFHKHGVLHGLMDRKPTEFESMIMRLLTQKAMDEGVLAEDFRMLDFRIDIQHDIASLNHLYRISWLSTEDTQDRRAYSFALDDSMAVTEGNRSIAARTIGEFVEQIKIRGELFFFKLHKHFPKKLKQVHTLRDGRVVVEFKNGRTVESHESRLDDKEFLAECIMVHDL